MPRSPIAVVTLVLVVLALTLIACGEDSERAQPGSTARPAQTDRDGDGVADSEDAAPEDAATGAVKAVTGSLALEVPAGGPPDAGTQAGHRAGAARGRTRGATFSFGGTISPADSEVAITTAQAGPRATVRTVGEHGDFRVHITGLRAGTNRFTLRATADGYEPWVQNVVITRRA